MAIKLESAVPDLYEQQVLDNLAEQATKPSALPYFGLPQSGSSANTRTVSANYSPGWDFITGAGKYLGLWVFDKQTAQLQGMNANADTFQVQPETNPDKLLLMQSAFHRALGIDDQYASTLMKFLQSHSSWTHYDEMAQPGWFVAGRKRDVPKHACYVGHYCETYIWVPPDQVENLARFTLVILDIETTATTNLPKAVHGGVELTPRITPFPYPAAPTPP
jgi:hypothetical protein